KAQVVMSIKSLNSRFFEANCRFPYQLSLLETDVVKRLKQTLIRGNVTCILSLDNNNFFKEGVVPSLKLVESYVQAIETIKRHCTISGDVNIHDILLLPNVFAVQELIITDETKQTLLEAVSILAQEVVATQLIEGE